MMNNKEVDYTYTASYESETLVAASEMFGPSPRMASGNAAVNDYNNDEINTRIYKAP